MLMKMIRGILIAYLIAIHSTFAAAAEQPIKLEKIRINTHDVKSIQRGAKVYATLCLTCHSLDYMEHDPIAKAAGITPDKMPDKNKKWWFGTSPPNLTLMAKVHSPEWLYTYLHVFYKDPGRPIGTNNLLIDNVNMPNPFIGLQGEQELIVNKKELFLEPLPFTRKLPYYTVLQLTRAGSVPPDEFDKMTRDLVNFLVYASEPKKYTRETLGMWVLIYIAIAFILIYLLKRIFWKQIKG